MLTKIYLLLLVLLFIESMNVEGSTEVIAPYETNFCCMTSAFSLNLFPYVWNRNNNNMYFSELWELSESKLDVKKIIIIIVIILFPYQTFVFLLIICLLQKKWKIQRYIQRKKHPSFHHLDNGKFFHTLSVFMYILFEGRAGGEAA